MKTLKTAVKIMALIVVTICFNASAQQKPNPPVAKKSKEGAVYVSVEKSPQFPGGQNALTKYLATSVKYPVEDKQKKLQGKVFIEFVVEPDGKVSNVKAIRGPSETLKAEAIRTIANSPKWIPGKQDGKVVRAQFIIPINFTLS
jgi:protein TonB